MVAVALVLLVQLSAPATAPSTPAELLWLGQSAFRLTTPGGKVIVIDPLLKGTPEEFTKALGKAKVKVISLEPGGKATF